MFYLCESEATATMFYLCESEATATMFYLCESEAKQQKRLIERPQSERKSTPRYVHS
ncbi:hypothetical protein FJQ98_21760 [Lysinibacillus agricola]|uniref:Uncharacterized protein n=1 Tax=Lysinibacillus agricola TaxID=2590012 RepID=A0ABX7ARE4_9BACI|nr:hypothetical protein [Lysinibacillus agricola]QQP11780.1 hypothetical protein FJQ98_21760 [Lysinibacillus agricola]